MVRKGSDWFGTLRRRLGDAAKSEGRNPTPCDGATARREEARRPKSENRAADWICGISDVLGWAGYRRVGSSSWPGRGCFCIHVALYGATNRVGRPTKSCRPPSQNANRCMWGVGTLVANRLNVEDSYLNIRTAVRLSGKRPVRLEFPGVDFSSVYGIRSTA
jgi:hypothetical protein